MKHTKICYAFLANREDNKRSKPLTKESPMPRAIWNGTVLAESDRCETVENNCYFPANTVKREYLKSSETHTICPWKGEASYYDVDVGGQVNKDAAWYYIPRRRRRPNRLPAMWRFGRALRLNDSAYFFLRCGKKCASMG